MLEQNRIDEEEEEVQDTNMNYIPSKFLLLSKTGHLLYAYNFQNQQSIKSNEDFIVTDFLSAINSFSRKLFAGFIDYIKIDINHIILKFSDPVFFILFLKEIY